MKKVYLFGAYFGNKKDGSRVFANYILVFQSMPSLYDIMNELKKGDKELVITTIISMQFLTKEQFYALKGEEKQETQSDLLDMKIANCELSLRVKLICRQNGLNTVRDVCRLAKTDWLKFHNSGWKSLYEMENFLKSNGLGWRMNV